MSEPAADNRPLLSWALSFLRPYQGRVVLLAALLLAEVALGALQPWPLKMVVDYVLSQQPLPQEVGRWTERLAGTNLLVLLVVFVLAGVVLQITKEVVSAFGTQVQVDTGQRMVYDLRYRLFQHLQALSLTHHIKTNTGDAVYRVDVDAY